MAYRIAILPLAGTARPDQAPVGLENTARALPGVRDVEIDPVGQTVRLVYDTSRTNLLDLMRLLAQHGYPVGTPIMSEGEL